MATKRLIDANAFECVCVNGKSDDFCNGVLYVLDMIDAQPTVEAVEVVHGRWARKQIGKYTGADEVVCSCCGCFLGVVCSDTGFKEATRDMNYCPNCGAKMDGDGND